MAQHGYLHDRYDRDDFGRGDDRERGWRGRDDERSWRDRDSRSWDDRGSNWRDRDEGRGSMFGWRDDDRRYGRDDDDRGFLERAGEQISSWFSDDDDEGRGRERGRDRGLSRSGPDRGFGDQQSDSRRGYSAHPDDHYRSWRDKQVEALDRDYQDYCREREQQFHSEFDSWRRNRPSQGSGSRDQGSDDVMELDNPAAKSGREILGATSSPMGAATLGTNNSENTDSAPPATGRRRR